MNFGNLSITSEHNVILTLAGLFGLTSIYFFLQKKNGAALIFLILSGGLLRILMTYIDPFIWLWDEQFHALVAKNMVGHPFKPTLYDNPILAYDYRLWDLNHIWLHKQPLFLWQMAASMKIFGYNEWAFRLPSAIMSVLMIPVIYRMGSIVLSREVGYLAGFFAAYSYIFHELVTGSKAGDHNDVAFVFYVTLSIWAWMEYVHSGKTKWAYIIGAFSGAAVMVKWMPGLLVYSGWFISRFFTANKQSYIRKFLPLTKSLLTTLLVFVPWLIYTRIIYPNESAWELYMYHLHFTIPVEGHGGDALYHFQILPFLYGSITTWLLLPAVI
ncbi:MAG: ArnT family glycosyltransferase, partial [Flavobacteriales bacterium]